MRYGQITLEKEQSARLLGWGIRFFLTAALTASRTPGGYAPFALGCIAAAGPGADGGAALLGPLLLRARLRAPEQTAALRCWADWWARSCLWTSPMRFPFWPPEF